MCQMNKNFWPNKKKTHCRYDVIGKMETFDQDSKYIQDKLNLPLETIQFRG